MIIIIILLNYSKITVIFLSDVETGPPEKPDRQIGEAGTQSFGFTKSLRINVKGEQVSIQTIHLRPRKLIINAGRSFVVTEGATPSKRATIELPADDDG